MDTMPEKIGNCRLTGKLGQGGMGAVYKGTHETLGRDVAIKLLPPELSQNKEYVKRFLREARAAANLHHPNIVQVYDAGEEQGRHYIVMEYVDGTSLAQLLKQRGALPEPEALGYLAQAAKGLAAAHENGMVHRDVKPENMLLNKKGVLKIADFGLVTAVQTDESLTQEGAMLGTPSYMSPEQCEGLTADARSDVYSLGASFFRLMSGHAPFSASTPIGIMFKHKHEPVPDPRAINPRLSESATQLILKMMAKEPGHRFQSAQDVALASEMLLRGETPTIHMPPAGTAATPAGSAAFGTTPGTGGMAYTPTPSGGFAAGTALTPVSGMTPGTAPTMVAPGHQTGATPTPYTPYGTPLPPTQITGQTPIPATTMIQPPRSKAPLLAALAALMVLFIGGGAYYALVYHPQQEIAQARQDARDRHMMKQYDEAIATLEAAYAKYPKAEGELKPMRDRIEADQVAAQIAQLRSAAKAALDAEKHEAAIEKYAQALTLAAHGKTLPGFADDPELPVLKKKAEDLREFTQWMSRGESAEKAGNYAEAMGAYAQAIPYEVKGGTLAQASTTRAKFLGLMSDAKRLENGEDFAGALAAVKSAAELGVSDVSEHRARLERRIQHDRLLAESKAEQDQGRLREAAAKLEEAGKVAPNDSAGEQHREAARGLMRQADYRDAMAAGEKALQARNWEAALTSFTQAGKLDPQAEAPGKLYNQAAAGKLAQESMPLLERKDWEAATQAFAKAVALDPDHAAYQTHLKTAQDGLAAYKDRQARIASLKTEAQGAENGRFWSEAIDKYNVLSGLDPDNRTVYEQRINHAKYEQFMGKAQDLEKAGQLAEALQQAKLAMPFDPTGGQQAQAVIQSINAKLQVREAAVARARALALTSDYVKEGKIADGLAVIRQAAAQNPDDAQLAGMRGALEDVDAIAKGFVRLQELQADAKASIDAALQQDKDDKKMNAWRAEVAAFDARLRAGKGKVQQAWLDQRYEAIQPVLNEMRGTAREMGQLYARLSGEFRGKAAKAAKPKMGLSFGGGGGGWGGGGGGGVNVPLGAEEKDAAVYDATATTLERLAGEASAIGATR